MRRGLPGLLCAIAFFAGTCTGLGLAPDAGAWVDVACIASVILPPIAWLARRASSVSLACTLTAVALMGVVSAGKEATSRAIDAPIGLIDPEPALVRFEARLLERFHPPDAAKTDLLDVFQPDADQPPWSASAELLALHGEHGRKPTIGRVTISAPTGPHTLVAGDMVQGVGWLAGPSPPANPGERDARLGAWHSGWIGRLRVDTVPERTMSAGSVTCALEWTRAFADRGLLASLDGWCDGQTRALVVAMTTGRRMPGYASLRQTFAATGLSHFLAISGFNVAVLFVTCGAAMELLRVPGSLRGPTLAVMAVIFLLVVDVEVSVFRAGVAGLLTGVSITLGRAWRSNGLLAAAAIVTLVADPRAAWNTGFQLSYLAVLALRCGSGPVEAGLRAVCTRKPAWVPVRLRTTLAGARTAFAASAAASIASTPVTLAWFGSLNPWCAVASTLLGPVAAALTVVATVAVAIGQVPIVGTMIGAVLAALAWLFRTGVAWVGTWPGCALTADPLPWWWAVITLVATFGWWLARDTRCKRGCVVGMAIAWCAGMLAWRQPPVPPEAPGDAAFEWTSISIGDGSVHLLRAGGCTVLFDAGSISRGSAGSTTIVPALRALGVSGIDAVVVSHPHLDHFAAIPEVLDAFTVRRVLLTEPWFRDARPETAPHALLACLRRHGIEPERVIEGTMLRQGPVTWRCVHPPAGYRAGVVNDGSAAFVLTHDAVVERPLALLVGDAQDQSIARLLARRDILRPWVMELPHHGGWRPLAQTLCEWVRPAFVMQSTGARRFRHDRFDPCLHDAVRGVTCRDGALRFSLDPANPPPRLERWSEQGWVSVRPP